jgi:hypothetical protein
MRRIILLTWYFFALTSSGGVVTVGPFTDDARCETVRRLAAEYTQATPVRGYIEPVCWVLV